MDKFSKVEEKGEDLKSKKEVILFENNYIKVNEFEEWTIVQEKDCVVVVPILTEYNQVVLRSEYIPTYKFKDGQELHLACVTGQVEEGENIKETLRRELEEEAGLVLRDNYPIQFEKSMFVSKTSTAKYHIAILPLSENDYHEVIAKGDGSRAEKLSKSVKVDIKQLNNLFPSDTITHLMLLETKKYLNLL